MRFKPLVIISYITFSLFLIADNIGVAFWSFVIFLISLVGAKANKEIGRQ